MNPDSPSSESTNGARDAERPAGSRLARWRGLWGVAGRRVFDRLFSDLPNRTALSVFLIAIAVALILVVTSVGLGLAAQSSVYGGDVDYWIVPETGTTKTTVFSVEGPQLGDVHARSAEIAARDDVIGATPVLIDLLRVRAERSAEPEYVLGIGVLPQETPSVAGVPTASLTPGDPHYANGTYDGEITGEVALSPAAADALNASRGDSLVVASASSGRARASFSVSDVPAVDSARSVPVALFHLSELQALSGAQQGDLADQLLVRTNSPGVKPALREVYPDATVVTRSELVTQQFLDSELPLAVSLASLIVGLGVAALFLATTMALEVEADRATFAVLGALGFSRRSRLTVVAATTLTLSLCGGVLGAILGVLAILGVNVVVAAEFSIPSLAYLHPALPVYALVVALGVGVIAAPYPLLVAHRTGTLAEVSR